MIHKFIPMLQAKKKSRKSSGGQWIGKNWRKIRRGTWQSQKHERGDRLSKNVGRCSSFRIIDAHTPFEKCWVGGKAPKGKLSSSIPRVILVKDDSGFYAVIHRTRIISFSDESSKSHGYRHGYHLQFAKLRWHAWDPVSVLTKCWKIPKSECPDIWIRLPRHKWYKVMVEYRKPSRSSWAKSVWSLFGMTIMVKAVCCRSFQKYCDSRWLSSRDSNTRVSRQIMLDEVSKNWS